MEFFEDIYEQFERAEKRYHEPADEQSPFQGKYAAKEILQNSLEKIQNHAELKQKLSAVYVIPTHLCQ